MDAQLRRIVTRIVFAFSAVFAGACATPIDRPEDEAIDSKSDAVVIPTYQQQAYVKASNTDVGDVFDITALSADGNTLAVGACGESSNATGINGAQNNNLRSSSGAVYVFTRSSGAWTQQAYIKASNTGENDLFCNVSLSGDGNTLAVGASGEDSNATGINGSQTNDSAAESGAVYVFTRSSGVWTQQAYIKASNTGAGDAFGGSLALSTNGSTLVVGAYGEQSNAIGINGNQANNSLTEAGAAYVFTRSGTTWSQQAYVKASNTGDRDSFGASVAISGDGSRIAVGAQLEDSSATGINGNQLDNTAQNSGAAYVFARSTSGTWAQEAYVKASNTGSGDTFGKVSLSSDGATLAVGADNEQSNATGVNGDQSDNSATSAGAAYVYTRSGTAWALQAYVKAFNTEALDVFSGVRLSGDGNVLAVSAWRESSSASGVNGNQADNSALVSGAVYVYMRSGGTWIPRDYVKASNPEQSDMLGFAAGPSLSSDGSTLAIGAHLEASAAVGINGNQGNNSAPAAGAVYVFSRITVPQYEQTAYIKASNTQAADQSGHVLALSADGNTLAVASEKEDSSATGINGNQSDNSASGSGAVYVYVRTGGVWTQQAYIKASNTAAGDRFGFSVALSSDGNTLAVGAAAEDSAATGINGNQSDNSSSNSGAVYVFTRSGSTWTQQAYIKASNTGAGDFFGASVTLSANGNTLGVGAAYEDSNATGINGTQSNNSATNSGAGYVFVRSSGVWTQQAYIKASNTGANDLFFYQVLSGDGNTLLVAAYEEDSNATLVNGNQTNDLAPQSGAAYVFTRSGTTWSQQAYIKASNTGGGDSFGSSLAVSSNGNTIAIGAAAEDSAALGVNGNQTDNSANGSGAAYIYTRSSGAWAHQAYLKASNTNAGDAFGVSIGLSGDGNTVAISAPSEDSAATGVNPAGQITNGAVDSGALYVFGRSGSNWTQRAFIKASNTQESDQFGWCVGLSSDASTLIVSSVNEDSSATGVNGSQTSNAATDSGAVYAYLR